jgi:hypothetical protein
MFVFNEGTGPRPDMTGINSGRGVTLKWNLDTRSNQIEWMFGTVAGVFGITVYKDRTHKLVSR